MLIYENMLIDDAHVCSCTQICSLIMPSIHMPSTDQHVKLGVVTIESAEASIQQVALCAELQQVAVHLRLGNVFINLNSHREAFQLCAVLSYLKAAFVGF